jgi:hypothetical protein
LRELSPSASRRAQAIPAGNDPAERRYVFWFLQVTMVLRFVKNIVSLRPYRATAGATPVKKTAGTKPV